MKPKSFVASTLSLALAAVSFGTLPTNLPKGPVDPSLYSGLVWRNVGPFRSGRVSAVSGAVGQPGVFYAGAPNGGLWKSTNAGITWEQVLDSVQSSGSVGAVQVAPSDPNIVYVGMGDSTNGRTEGDGVYKSIDGGKTWTHVGLEFARQIPRIIVDPKDPNVVLAACLGDSKLRSEKRGIYRSTDGGKSWKKTSPTDSVTGAQDISYAFDQPSVLLATTQRHCQQGPGDNDKSGSNSVSGTALLKSTDGGQTWTRLKGNGLPNLSGRTMTSIAMNTEAKRMFVTSNSGLYRSDDGGASWKQMDREDPRIRNGQGGYNCGVYVNTKDPDTVYVFNTCSYISHDGGKTFTGFKGAPGGDDPQQMWLDPKDGNRLFMGVDQGATVSLDGGRTWSPWYNLPNGQFYHIAVSNSWPYWIYATMQDSGSIGMASRGIYGEITPLDWSLNPGWEWGSITVDPLDPHTLYSTGQTNDVIKQSFPSGQWVSTSPDNDAKLHLRHDFNQPIQFNAGNPHELFLGYQYLMSSTDGGRTWHALGQDLSQPAGYVPPKPEKPKPEKKEEPKKKPAPKSTKPAKDTKKAELFEIHENQRVENDDDQGFDAKEAMEHAQEVADAEAQRSAGSGSIASLSSSTLDGNIIWAAMSNGMIKLTKDHGKTWSDVEIKYEKKSVVCIDASHTDPASAYAAINNDEDPVIYRTKDYGQTWTKIVKGLPTGEIAGSKINVVRADLKKEGLLFAGSESSMYVSFNDGESWQSLRLNTPTTSYRDIVVKDNDLVVGTYGRSFWILDDISPLRQVRDVKTDAYLFAPGNAVRSRRNVNQDTPMPPEVPHALNPPPGALIYYHLTDKPKSDITIEVSDSTGKVVRHYSSAPIPPAKDDFQPFPDFWKEVVKPLPTEVGTNRINWDLRYDNPPSNSHGYDISATPGLTPLGPLGPLVYPGTYTVTLTVDGKKSVQKVKVTNDPRSPASDRDLREQHETQMSLLNSDYQAMAGTKALKELRAKISELQNGTLPKEINTALDKLGDALDNLGGESNASFSRVQSQSVSLLGKIDFGDMAPSQPIRSTAEGLAKDLATLIKAWDKVQGKDINDLNAALAKANLAQLPTVSSKSFQG